MQHQLAEALKVLAVTMIGGLGWALALRLLYWGLQPYLTALPVGRPPRRGPWWSVARPLIFAGGAVWAVVRPVVMGPQRFNNFMALFLTSVALGGSTAEALGIRNVRIPFAFGWGLALTALLLYPVQVRTTRERRLSRQASPVLHRIVDEDSITQNILASEVDYLGRRGSTTYGAMLALFTTTQGDAHGELPWLIFAVWVASFYLLLPLVIVRIFPDRALNLLPGQIQIYQIMHELSLARRSAVGLDNSRMLGKVGLDVALPDPEGKASFRELRARLDPSRSWRATVGWVMSLLDKALPRAARRLGLRHPVVQQMLHLRQLILAELEHPSSMAAGPTPALRNALKDLQILAVGTKNLEYYAGLARRRPMIEPLDLPKAQRWWHRIAPVGTALKTADDMSKSVIALVALLIVLIAALRGWSVEPLKGLLGQH